ncbi:amino acid adenylation domain-containing protein [Tumebacillus sp. BK434]|uniref:non-ribosomal peptide synthetase n=1 Tax=Tumebacillus sp. BK434 TaxID=2512169 RepID=UPI00104F2349|nr:non-ribosomal peptide synthetase [Tumebacillus sp. BK434]TCP54483.1 amino acid adenylation domain-containing protein [Tumebacillus sp. BK434]
MKRENIESLYELTPLQHGMLFHTLYAPDSGVYAVQLTMTLEGQLNQDAFSRAFRMVMERHPILRTAFFWEDLEKPLQVVGKEVELPLRVLDWSGMQTDVQHARAADFSRKDRLEPFTFTEAPVMRVTLIRFDEQTHSLVWTFHHILLDGWSIQLILKELWALYEAYQCGREPQLPASMPFRNYLSWLQRQNLGEAEAYWRKALQGFAKPTPLPLDYGKRVIEDSEVRNPVIDHRLSSDLYARLKGVSRSLQVTMNTLLQGIWALYLSRASGENDVLFGSTVSGRPGELPGVERMAGLFINTLPVRVGVELDAELGLWLKALQASQLEARQYEHTPLTKIQMWSEVPGDLKLFESLFVFENFLDDEAGEEEHIGSLKITDGSSAEQTSFPLTLTVIPAGELILRVQYDATRYAEQTVKSLLEHLEVMLNAVADRPDVQLKDIPLMSAAEHEAVLVSWNATAVPFPSDLLVHQYVEAHAANQPDALAVRSPGKAWTYGELNSYANRLAHFLKAEGMGPERLVGVCLERSPELVAAYLAAWKTGAAFLMIDPKYPGERIRFMLQDAGAGLLLTQESLQEIVAWEGGKSVCLDADAPVFARESKENLQTVSELSHLASVLYTSGSTGTPKGVELEHASILNFAHWYARRADLTAADCVTHIAGTGFDGTLMDLIPALLSGCSIVQPDEETRYAPQKLQAWMIEQEVTVAYATTALTEALMLLEWPENTPLRMQFTGGEALHIYPRPDLPFRVINGYGPTEATVYTTAYEVPSTPDAGRLPSIGRPLANMSVYVLDESLRPLPVGMPGELYAGGIGLGRGYLRRPELTAEKFLDTEFGRLYKTGDKVRWLPDGNLEYFGRLDQLVKIRGFRIELGEIEAALLKHPQVKEAAVLVQEQQILAYVAGSAVPSPQELRQYLAQDMPEFMLPAYFVALAALPLTANGKVNRRALPAPGREHAAGAEETVRARTETERRLVDVWQKVLKLDGIGVTDNFFALGGHSLLATQVMGQVASACGVELPLRTLFEAPTIEALAKLIDGEEAGKATEPSAMERVERSQRLPLSFAQERLWFLEQFNTHSAAYNIPMALRMTGQLDVAALQASFNEIMSRHEALRTTFAVVDGQPEQVILAEQELPFELVDYSALPPELAMVQAALGAVEEGETPFTLTAGALVRAKLFRIAEADHVLLLTMHHIISDGWSMGVLIDELSKLYDAFRQGAASPLAPLPIQYADFAHWQRQWFRGDVEEQQLAYWKQTLQGAPAVLQLPTDKPRPAVQTFVGATREIVLSAALTERLKALSQQEGATLFMTLLAAFNVLLARYSGQEDIVVGSPIAGRTRPETHGLIGFFVNTLALRTDLSEDPSFRELLQRVREVTLGAYAHQDLPFERLVQEVRPERDMSHPPMFQVMFALQNAPMDDLNLSGLTWRDFPVERGTSKFDLSLLVQEENGGLAGIVEYNTDLFAETTIVRMIDSFAVLLEHLTGSPNESVFAAAMITPEEQRLLLEDWKGNTVPFDEAACGHHLFERQAERTPDLIAVEYGDVTLTYRELNERANRLAHHLQARGVGPEQLVAIVVERGPEMIVGALGVLKAGGAYVPIDPAYPADRIAFQLEDGAVSVLLTQSHLAAGLPAAAAHVICLDVELFPEESAANPESCVRPDNLAYVIYTSGSTGKPKGVLIEHRSLVNFTEWYVRYFDVQAGSRSFQFSSFSFDASVMDIYPTLAVGATLVLFKREELLPGPQLQQLMQEKRVNRMFATPSMMMQLPSGELPDLHTVIIGGEALSREVVQLWQGAGRIVYNAYGPTETTVLATVGPCDGESVPPIGQPIANAELYVLDAKLQPVPVGVPGELHIGGVGVARGYLNRADLTAEKFIETPYGRLYKTGDAVRWLADGSLEYFGRIDQQVKIRGFRIELGEIEAVLRQHPAVQDAAVLAVEMEAGDKQLVGYVAVGEQEPPAASELRAHLKSVLPEFMVPGLYVMLEALPLTVNRKVDRAALPAPDRTQSAEADQISPRTPVEAAVANVWQTVLRLPQVGVQENFFELGGHSLLATQVMSHLTAALGVELPLRALFEAPTVEGLSARVEQLLGTAGAAKAMPLLPVAREAAAELSFAQERLWLFEQFEPGTSTYNMPFALRLTGSLNTAALQAAFDEILRRHEVLRTVYVMLDGAPKQMVVPDVQVPFTVHDLSELPAWEREMQAVLTAIEEGDLPFDLAQGPMLRTVLLKLDAEEHVLLMTFHHIASDGWSMGILIEELSAFYQAYVAGATSPLTPLPVQYADYAHWQRKRMEGGVLEEQMSYWKEQMRDASFVLQLPTDKPRPAMQTFNGAMRELSLQPSLLPRLKELSQQEGATLFMTLLSAFNILLARLSGQEDIVVGSPIAGRTNKETEGLIGFFVNTLALRTELSGELSFRELLARVKETTLGAFAHQEVPFERLVRELQPERNMSYAPLFQVMFALQNMRLGDLELPGLTLSDFPVDKSTSMFDLTLSLYEGETGLEGNLKYNTDLFEEETMARLIERFELLLEGIVSAPDRRIAELPIVTEAERKEIAEWNETAAPFSQDVCAHHFFEQQAEREPERIAVEFGETMLTYRELNERANRLAHHLQARGVGPDRLVAIAVEKGPEMLIGLLGVLKAGGAYLPIDPAYPAERIAYQLEDGGVQVLLTQSHLAAELPSGGADMILLDVETFEHEPVSNPQSAVQPSNLAYVIHTSGSTGKPKGVLIEHRNLVNFIEMFLKDFDLQAGMRCSMFPSFSFDSSVKDLYPPLAVGATLVLFTREQLLPGPELQQLLREKRVERISTTPAMLAQLPSDDLPALNTVICGGTVLPLEVVQRWKTEGRRVINVYGPTETTVFVTAEVCDGERAPSIGSPLQNSTVHVLDAYLQPVPVGVAGELHIGGAGVARGYLNRAELTAEKFVETPVGRLYKTGDAVRWTKDGKLEYIGRIDLQVKVRGYRIELGEIEALLRQHPAVQDAAVVALPDRSGENQLVGYVAVGAESALATADLRGYLKAHLPEFMVPGLFVQLEALPLTVNRKIDRAALPAPDRAMMVQNTEVILPRTPLENTVAGVWRKVLGLPLVGVEQNFFELGGHSLLATQVMASLASELHLQVPLRTLFEAPTVAALAAGIERMLREKGASKTLPILPVPRSQALPLSFAQERLWFYEQFHQGTSTYNMPFALRLKGQLDQTALRRTFDEILRRHEVLRTSFVSRDGEAVQVIGDEVPTPFAVVDLRELPDWQREMQAALTAIEEGELPFAMTEGPMLRAVLLQLDEAEHVLLVTMHHIASDGWSMSVLTRELSVLYEAFASGQPSPLAPLPVQYADYANWQREWFAGGVLEEQLGYWKRQLQDASFVLELPTDKQRPAVQTFNGVLQEISLAQGLLPRLKALSQQEGVTLFMTLLAAFNTLLSRLSGQEDIVVGSPIAGRTRQETEGLIGFFVNTLALRTDLSGNPSFRELLARVRETTLDAYAHQDLPFERLVREVQPERDLSYSALFQVMFVLQNAPQGDLELPGLTLSNFPVAKATSMFDLTFALYEREDGLAGSVQYNTDLYEEETIQRIIGRFEVLLAGIAEAPDRAIAELPVLTPDERGLLAKWQETEAPYSEQACLHQLIEAQAARTPDAIAAESAEQTLTFRELNEQANRIARTLQERGVGPDQLVAIAVTRTPQMAVAVLAVLKAGGAYLPLDPTYPSERLAYLLADSQVKWLLTEQQLVTELPVSQAEIVLLDADWSSQSAAPVTSAATPDHLAYVIYTSGSTGQPKGVLVNHRGLVNFVEAQGKRNAWQPGDRVLKFTSFAFDASACDLLVPLAFGATVVFAGHLLPGPELSRLLRTEKITGICISPSALAMLPEEDLPDLRVIMAGGEVVSAALIGRFADGRDFYVEYGPTETTVAVTAMKAAPGNRSALLGYPLPNVRLHVLDAHQQPVAIGVLGELHVSGPMVARGYLNRPDLTAEKFIEVNGERLYKTGDLARWLPDGSLEYGGRIDDQVKLRGFRVELGEIETQLRKHPAVKDAAVIVRDEALLGYVVAEGVSGAELRDHLAARLPEYMVPSLLIVLEAFPLTPNGKVDRRALPEPVLINESEYVAPRDAVELQVGQIFAELLGLPQVGAKDHFFILGGHSLLAVRLTAQLQQKFGQELPLAQLFQQATVEGIANLLRQGGQAPYTPLVELAKGEGSPFFCVHAVGGSALSYLELANALGGEQPFYAFQARGLEGAESPFADIETMAACYVAELVNVQPAGPIHLGGWSFGGSVAYEMVRQLQAQGREVASLVLIDSYAPTLFVEAEREVLPSFAADLAGQLGVALLPGAAEELARLEAEEALSYLHRHLATDLSLERLTRLFAVFKANVNALATYMPQGTLSVPATLFLSETSAGHPLAPTLGWEELVERVEVKAVQGDHFTVLRNLQHI